MLRSPESTDHAFLTALVASAEEMAKATGANPASDRLGQNVPVDLLASMGMLVMAWAQAEVILDAGISLILHDLHGKRRLGESTIPVSLKRKLDIWRRAHAKIAALKPDAAFASEVATKFTRLGQERHNVIHGSAMRMLSDGSVAFFRAYPKKGVLQPHLSTYSPTTIGDLTIEVVQLSIRLMAYVHRLVAEHGPPAGGETVDTFIENELRLRK